jgi:pimeloyl-ACP methyl ester carboxylesterase
VRREFFDFGNLRLSYLEANATAAKKLIIAHANGYAAGCYRYIIDHMASDFHVCALDFSGHGESEADLSFTSWNFFSDQIRAFLDHKKWTEVHAIGHSLGGGTLLRAASVDAGRFSTIVAFDPVLLGFISVLYVKLLGNPMAQVARERRAEFKSKDQALKIFSRHPSNRSWQPESIADYVEYCIAGDAQGARLKCDPRNESRIFSQTEFLHLFRLGHIRSRCHLVFPEKSNVCAPWVARRITRGNPASTIQYLKGTGHLLPFENRQLALQLIDECFDVVRE